VNTPIPNKHYVDGCMNHHWFDKSIFIGDKYTLVMVSPYGGGRKFFYIFETEKRIL
jgi:hypothetical protein